jgi:hypothetical protein
MLKKLLLITFLFVGVFASFGQQLAALDVVEVSYVTRQKFDSYISKKGFAFNGASYKTDTIARDFDYIGLKKSKEKDSANSNVLRSVTSLATTQAFCVNYRTTSAKECNKIKTDIKKEGFFCNKEADSLVGKPLLYQHEDVTITVTSKTIDTVTEYSFLIRKQYLPKPKEIVFAENLADFSSHENLRYYFGDKNVKKDIYFLSEKKIGKCSILFPNTNRQVVFLWEDEDNNTKLAKMYIGGQLKAESNLEYQDNIGENIWQLKSGVRQGMSLFQLRKLNDAAFNIHGGNSANTGMVFADSTGKINFVNETIILDCMNCGDMAFAKKTVINSDEAIQEERILFVHTIILDPTKIKVDSKIAR